MSVTELHEAVRRGDVERIRTLLRDDAGLADAVSDTDPRGTSPLHVAAEFGQARAAEVLLEYAADVTRLDRENDASALSWAAFFGRPDVVAVLLGAAADPSQRNKHGLTPLGCAIGGSEGRWRQFSSASLSDWERAAELIRAAGGVQ